MSNALKMACSGGAAAPLYADDVFSAYTYTGNGSTQTITNSIDLAGEGGLVWTKSRSNIVNHALIDTERGATKLLFSSGVNAEFTATPADGITSFNSDGYSLGADTSSALVNNGALTYVSWTFRKAPKFFDVVTYTGTGVARTIAHSLGQEVGMLIVKRTDSTGNWSVYHRSVAATSNGYLSLTTAFAPSGANPWNGTAPTSSVFSVNTDADVNANGATYVAYLFAHEPTGVIICDSFTTDGSGNGSFDPGWAEGVQYLTLKASSTTGDWETYDTARTSAWSGSDARLRPNLSNVEDSVSRVSASGTTINLAGLSASQTYIYVAVRGV